MLTDWHCTLCYALSLSLSFSPNRLLSLSLSVSLLSHVFSPSNTPLFSPSLAVVLITLLLVKKAPASRASNKIYLHPLAIVRRIYSLTARLHKNSSLHSKPVGDARPRSKANERRHVSRMRGAILHKASVKYRLHIVGAGLRSAKFPFAPFGGNKNVHKFLIVR